MFVREDLSREPTNQPAQDRPEPAREERRVRQGRSEDGLDRPAARHRERREQDPAERAGEPRREDVAALATEGKPWIDSVTAR